MEVKVHDVSMFHISLHRLVVAISFNCAFAHFLPVGADARLSRRLDFDFGCKVSFPQSEMHRTKWICDLAMFGMPPHLSQSLKLSPNGTSRRISWRQHSPV